MFNSQKNNILHSIVNFMTFLDMLLSNLGILFMTYSP